MPNTLCHIGIQAPCSRLLDRNSSLLLIVLACIIPDIPWIIQRILLKLALFDPYDLHLFCIGQASLFFCLVLAAALALLTVRPWLSFAVLAGNCLFHLLLDAVQIKWANGVHLFAPLLWSRQHFGLLWPEHLLWQSLTLAGFGYLLFHWAAAVHPRQRRVIMLQPSRLLPALTLVLLYLSGPLLFMSPIEETNTAYIRTLRNRAERTGQYVELDRVYYSPQQQTLRTFTGEQIELTGKTPQEYGLISVKGQFVAANTIEAQTIRIHSGFRNYASYLGLFMACALLTHSVIVCRKQTSFTTKGSHT